MARPEKNTVDYFPHPARHGKKMAYIRKKYGNDGYATWFIILEQLGDAERHHLNLGDEIGLMYLETASDVDQDTLLNIINDLVKLGEFDAHLWKNHRVLFSQKFVDSIRDAYLKRTNSPVTREEVLSDFDVSVPLMGVSVPVNSVTAEFTHLKGTDNTQRKGKEIKVEERKGNAGENSIEFPKDYIPFDDAFFTEHRNMRVDSIPIQKQEEPKEEPTATKEVVKSEAKKRLTQLDMLKSVTLPYETPEFRKAWEEWLSYKTLIKDPYKAPATMQAALKKFADHPIEVGILAINDSISNQWKGVFPDNKKYHERTQQTIQQPSSAPGAISRIYQKLAASRGAGSHD